MPGVLPLKTIQLNTSSQSRIAQACDRCRSKKIRCDGIQPNCTPCQAVNFECKTSDKLSRKAYPKGYTSSLEERVRELESEVRDLKDLLDEKDEKIDILSKMRHTSVAPSAVPTPPASTPSDHGKEELFKVQQTPWCCGKSENGDLFMGVSSGRPLVDIFKAKLQEDRKRAVPFETSDLFKMNPLPPKQEVAASSPPQIVSDQLINIFFQEWAPMFPILHRPTFLKTYQEFLTNPRLRDAQSHAQMYLVFGIATMASSSDTSLVQMYDAQWRKALNAVLFETSIETLQCLVLASLYSIVKGDNKRLLHFLSLAVSMSSLLGLQHSQKQFTHGALTRETRKKVFWSLYTIDCFAAASLGVSRLLKDSDIYTEEPCDVDDENVSERGFQATLPGESTKISSALGFFKSAKILARVLDELYPNASSYELSLSKVACLDDELNAWRDALPAHLRLEFNQDKLNFNVTSDRSPLLALVYFHIRSCIHRAVVSADIGEKGVTSVMALAESSKRISQLAQLLDQRSMSFTICVNRNEILALAGIGLLTQAVELRSDSRMCRENGKVVLTIADLVSGNSKSASITLKKVAIAIFGKDAGSTSPNRRSSAEGSMSPPRIPERKGSPKNQIQAIASRLSFSNSRQTKKPSAYPGRRSTLPAPQVHTNLAVYSRSGSHVSQGSVKSAATEPIRRLSSGSSSQAAHGNTPTPTNLDYLPIDREAVDLHSELHHPQLKSNVGPEWDPLLDSYHGFDTNGSSSLTLGSDYLGIMNYQGLSTPPLSAPMGLSPDAWGVLDPFAHGGMSQPHSTTAHSVLSLSDESLTSGGEELSNCDFGGDVFPGYAMPSEDGYAMPSEDGYARGFDEFAAIEGLSA